VCGRPLSDTDGVQFPPIPVKPTTAEAERAVALLKIPFEEFPFAGSAENNIKAAAKYLRYLAQYYLNDPAIDERNRVLMAMAAYNAGPGSLKKFRNYAAAHGFKTNVWFRNVEYGAAAIVGMETVQYIGNIHKYHFAYSILEKKTK
jgi:hypothetical protein